MKNLTLTIIIAALCGTMVALLKNQSHDLSDRYSHLGGDFELTHVSGPFKRQELKNHVSILYFGFTHCPDICPLALNNLVRVLDKLNDEQQKRVKKVFISVDYKRDTPKIVQEYAQYFGNDFIGLTGTKSQIEDITKKYAAHFEFVKLKDSALDYSVDHTSRFYLLDSNANIVATYADITNNPKFLKTLKKLIGLL